VELLHGLSVWQPMPSFPSQLEVNPDANVYGVALLLTLASGFLFGAVPARQVLRSDPYPIVKAGSMATVGRRITVQDVLLGAQIAICAVLVTSSFVAVRGLVRSLRVDFGFEPQNALLMRTALDMAGYRGDRVPAMQKRMREAIETIPGVDAVGLAVFAPLVDRTDDGPIFRDNASDLRPSHAAARALVYPVSPRYFHAAGTALLAGREFTWHDDRNAPRVAVVNAEFARKVFGSEAGALGRYYKGQDGTRIEVVGIAEQGKYGLLTEDPQPVMFLPIAQSPLSQFSQTCLVVRSKRDPQQLARAMRDKVRDLDPGLPVNIQTWYQGMQFVLFAPRMATISLGVLGVMAGMLSVTGIFGMAAYSVSKRNRELGIRIALGAQPKEVLKVALGRALKLLVVGSAAGLLLGILASHVLARIVYQATPRDPLVLAGVVLATFHRKKINEKRRM
jgi:predicted permease